MRGILAKVFLLCLLPTFGLAQGNDATPAEFSFAGGPILPNLIPEMDEIVQIGGLRYKFANSPVELSAYNGNGSDISYNNFSLGARGNIPIDGGMVALAYVGLDYHYYQPSNGADYLHGTGGHIGGGLMTYVGGKVWFRTEMKFNLNPGTALFIGFGFNFVFDDKK